MSFKGKVILLTGASSGIGAACAEYFAKEGALLSLVGRNAEKFEKVIEKIKESGAENEPFIILSDISIDSERIMSETIEKYGRLDILINNAAFAIPGTTENVRTEDFDAMMGTNVRGTFILTQMAIPHLIESKGNIVNVSSVCALRALPLVMVYSLTKAALDHFTRILALELSEKGVRVNSMSPGCINTSFHDCYGLDRNGPEFAALMDVYRKMHPIGRVGETEDCVNAIAFLANDNASFITGTFLVVDGGFSIK